MKKTGKRDVVKPGRAEWKELMNDTSGRVNKALERVGMFMKRVESEGKVVQFVGSERMR